MTSDPALQALADLARCTSAYLYIGDTGDGDEDQARGDLLEALDVAEALGRGRERHRPSYEHEASCPEASGPTALGGLSVVGDHIVGGRHRHSHAVDGGLIDVAYGSARPTGPVLGQFRR